MIQNRNTMSIHEAAILLDCYLQGQNEKHSKIEMARRASQLLRQMAVNSGKEIDDSYRNIAGISNRMRSLECAYTGDTSVPPSALFSKIVSMYRLEYAQYNLILSEAKAMISAGMDRKDIFVEWVLKKQPDHKTTWLEANLQRVELFYQNRNFISGSLFEVQDSDLLNMLRQDMHRDKRFQLSCGKLLKKVLDDFDLYCTFCQEMQETPKPISKLKENEFALSEVPDLSFTKPVAFTFAQEESESVKNWATLYRNVLCKLGSERINQIRVHCNESDFSSSGDHMLRPFELFPGLFTEMQFSASDLVKRLVKFFGFCGVDPSSLIIEYRRTGSSPSQDEIVVPEVLRQVVRDTYYSGIRFDETVLNILSNQCGKQITRAMCDKLSEEMFIRNDGLHFLPEQISDHETSSKRITRNVQQSCNS